MGKEFDVISDEYIAEAKPALQSIKPEFRRQAKRAFEAARQTGRKVYFHFNGEPCSNVIRKLQEYQRRYGVEMVINTEILY
jgi:cbb3-type cytochrome oxidase cytochrome c subunit